LLQKAYRRTFFVLAGLWCAIPALNRPEYPYSGHGESNPARPHPLQPADKLMPCGKKRKRHKIATHKRKKRLRKNRHKKKK
jgi:hypothetical protein